MRKMPTHMELEGKIIMKEHKKRTEINKLEDPIKSLQEKCKEL